VLVYTPLKRVTTLNTHVGAILGALALVPASLLPSLAGLPGPLYFAGALAVGLWFVRRSASFAARRTAATARGLLRASLVYLPAILALMFFDRLP
jgi:protoheme IX farnesyltransferase